MRAALLFAALVLLSACQQDDTQRAAASKWNDAVVHVVWGADQKTVDAMCREAGGTKPAEYGACAAVSRNSCTIYAVEPTSFNDKPALQRLGHEAWHCFGAEHK